MQERKRVYRSPLRDEQARRTRVTVLEAAGRCFLDRGYAATTMREIATAAGVSVQTVFAQGSKSALLLGCVDRAVVGDDDESPLADRELFVRFVTAADLEDKLDALRALAHRHGPLSLPMIWVFADAAAGDAELAVAWKDYEKRRRQDLGVLVEALEPWLRPGLDVERATDLFWAFFSHAPARNMLQDLGWTADEYADTLVDAVRRLLLA